MFGPILVAVYFPAHCLGEDLGNRPGDGARTRNAAIVDRIDRRDLGGGAAHEDFVRDVEIAAREIADDDFVAQVASNRDDARLRDALEGTGRQRRSDDATAADAEDVLTRAF